VRKSSSSGSWGTKLIKKARIQESEYRIQKKKHKNSRLCETLDIISVGSVLKYLNTEVSEVYELHRVILTTHLLFRYSYFSPTFE
jgi:hypothetical protein